MYANMVLANGLFTNEGDRREGGAEQDRVEQVGALALHTLPLLTSSQIQRLRVRLNAHSYDHDMANIQPRHPTTGRGWQSRNLRCTSCSDLVCPCCGRACCSFKACGLIVNNDLTPANVRAAASRDVVAISHHFPVGKESPTFIQCTHGSGCGQYVCPDCCGVCPDDCCQDVQCRVNLSNPDSTFLANSI